MAKYPNYISECLECNMPLEEKNPKDNQVLICKECGAIHIIELCFTLKNTGSFKQR